MNYQNGRELVSYLNDKHKKPVYDFINAYLSDPHKGQYVPFLFVDSNLESEHVHQLNKIMFELFDFMNTHQNGKLTEADALHILTWTAHNPVLLIDYYNMGQPVSEIFGNINRA